VGIATGVLSGLLGVGGGIVMVPALVALGYSRQRANSTSLAAILLVALAGAISFAVSDSVDWGMGLMLGLGGLIGSTMGAKLMSRLSGPTLAIIFGLVLLIAGLRMAFGGEASTGPLISSQAFRALAEVGIGAVAGMASGLAGVGGGTVMIPAMVFLLGIGQHTAEGTSLVAMLFTAAAATRVNVANHFVDWRAVGILGIVGAAVAPLAAGLALRIPAATLARYFGAFLILIAIRTIVRNRKRDPQAAPA
jgi:uncharacterized membrane protein YfcA